MSDEVRNVLLAAARGLVIIDPSDEEAIDRLTLFHSESFDALRKIQPPRNVGEGIKHTAMMAYALRKFVDPNAAPIQPTEPQGVGAVVENNRGEVFVRHVVITNSTPWRLTDQDWRKWDGVGTVVAIHSFGAEMTTTVTTNRPPETDEENADG